MTGRRVIYCCGTGEGNAGAAHPPQGAPPALGFIEGDAAPGATWGWLCATCVATWVQRRQTPGPAGAPGRPGLPSGPPRHPYHLLTLVDPPGA